MRTLRKAWFLRPLAWLTTVALLSPMLLTASPAQAAAPPATVAVVQVSNQSGSSVQNLASRLAAALTEKLALSGQFKAIGQAAVDQAIDAAGIRLPLRADTRAKQLADIAAALTSDYLIVAAIDNVEVDAERQVAAVTTRLELYSRLAGGELTTAETTAFNLARSNNAAVLVDDALDQAALYAVRELASNLAIVGKVTSPPLEDTVRISLSESDALRKGAQFSLLRDGVKYGTAELLLARGGDAECRLVERLRPEITPGVNDTAVLYKQGRGEPTAHDPDVDPGKDVPTGAERSRSNTGKVLGIIGGVALLALGVWAYFAAQDDREEARTASLVNPPNNSTLQVDSTNGLINALTFTATSVRSSEQLTLQVANDPNFASLAYTETKVGTSTGGTGGTGGTGTGTVSEPVTSVSFSLPEGSTVLAPGTYYWRVISVSGDDSYTSNVFSFNLVRQGGSGGAFLRSPDTVNALAGNGSVEVQWSPVPGAANYQIWRRILTPRFANQLARNRTFQPSTGTNIWLRSNGRRSPRADRGRGASGFATAPASRQDTSSLAGFSLLATVPGTSLSFTDSTVQNGTEYQWVVLSVDANGVATPLGEAQAGSFATTTPLSSAPPATPTSLTATPGDGQVVLTWTPGTESDLAGYQVFRSTSANGNFVDITNNLVIDDQSPAQQALSAGPGDVSVTDRGLTNGVQVFYRIRAVQVATLVNGSARGGLESSLSDAVTATPSSAPPQELQLVQPVSGSTVDANRPLFAWRGVTGASEYVLQLSTSAQFPAQGLITATANDTELIYPANLPALTQGQQYFVRVGVFDQTQQALRFGPTTSFIRGAVQRFTTTITATLSGANLNGSRVSIDGADTGEVTPAEFILSPKAGNAPYTIAAVFNDTDGTRYSGSVSYRPGVDNAAVRVPLTAAGTAPTVPTGLTATGQTDRVVLRWNPDPNLGTAATVAATYSVRRRSTTEEGPFSEIARVTAPSTPSNSGASQLLYTDFNVRQGVRYYYQIVALSAAGVESVPSVTANAVAGIGVIQVLAPQDNQTFEADITGPGWDTSMDFAWVAVPNAVRYIFEIGLDPDLHRLLSNGNQIIAAGAQPATTVEVSDTAPTGFQFFNDGDGNTVALYWRVAAVDENNLIVNQTEARRVFVNQPGLMEIPDN